MPFEVIQNDITLICADAIVNTANPQPVIGGGTDVGIHSAADLALLEPWEEIGPIAVGEAAITPGFGQNENSSSTPSVPIGGAAARGRSSYWSAVTAIPWHWSGSMTARASRFP